MRNTVQFIHTYLRERPLFLSVLRGKEASLYHSYLPLPGRVLDVGCGDGFFARVTFGVRKIDVGLDMEDSRIGEAEQSGAYERVVRYNGMTIPFADRRFQTVVINSVLEHVDDVPRVVSESYRVLHAGGLCYVTVMAAPWERNLFGAVLFGDAYRRWMKKKQVHKHLYTSSQWRRVFQHAGFRVVTVQPYVSPRAARWLDILHYVSVPSLLCRAVYRRWVCFPALTKWYPGRFFASLMEEPVSLKDAGALFFVLRRHP